MQSLAQKRLLDATIAMSPAQAQRSVAIAKRHLDSCQVELSHFTGGDLGEPVRKKANLPLEYRRSVKAAAVPAPGLPALAPPPPGQDAALPAIGLPALADQAAAHAEIRLPISR